MTRVFVDGSSGTTGLRIYERLLERQDIEPIILSEDLRKLPEARRDAIQRADIVFLCLPDAAAIEAEELARGSDAVIIDTSTAHRVSPGWVYGFPELPGMRERIAASRRIANPGCHASGFIALVAPLVRAGVLSADEKLAAVSLTGYSGGGKSMIAEYEAAERSPLLDAPRAYALTQKHKHLSEMRILSGLDREPAFFPVVADFYSGMETLISLYGEDLDCSMEELRDIYREAYPGPVIYYRDMEKGGFVSAAEYSGRDDMAIMVSGNEERLSLAALFDNLGKGASGAALQNMNIVLGVEETLGLDM